MWVVLLCGVSCLFVCVWRKGEFCCLSVGCCLVFVGVFLVMSSYMLIFEVMLFRPFVGVGRWLVLAGVVLCISATISGMFSGVRKEISGVNWFVVVISGVF